MKKSLSAFKVLFALVIALSAVFGFVGCNNPAATPAGNTDFFNNVKPENIPVLFPQDCVNYIANNSDFVFDVDYTNTQYGTFTFKIAKNGVVSCISDGMGDEVGTLVSAFKPYGYDGIMLIITTSEHTNYSQNQYPNYNEQNPHEGCFTAIYLKNISANSVEEVSAQWAGLPVEHQYTACASTFDYLKELFITYGYAGTCDATGTTCTR